jgi:hypothetical protein
VLGQCGDVDVFRHGHRYYRACRQRHRVGGHPPLVDARSRGSATMSRVPRWAYRGSAVGGQ